MNEKESYRQKIRARLDAWNAEIDKFEAKADQAQADVKLEYYEQLKKLRALQEVAGNKLDELEDAGEDVWEDFKDGADIAADALGAAVDSIRSRFG